MFNPILTIFQMRRFILILFCCWYFFSPAPSSAGENTGLVVPGSEVIAEIEPIECPLRLPPGDSGGCLMAWVPMSYTDAAPDGSLPDDAPRIGVHLIALGNFVTKADPDPLVVIAGGPGQAAVDLVGPMSSSLEQRRNRSIILVDQRGTGFSRPVLHCPNSDVAELDDYPFNDPSFDPEKALADRITACRDRLVGEGVDLAAFDTRSAALDLKAIRRGLELQHWNLLGTSYGSRVVMDALRIDPQGIRAAVLNSPMTVVDGFSSSQALGRARTFEQMFEECAMHEGCSQAFPNLRQDLEDIATHLKDNPLRLSLRDQQSGRLIRQDIYWNDIITVLGMHLAFTSTAQSVPRYINELAQVIEGRLNLNDDEVAHIFQPELANIEDELAIGMHLSVRCREDYPGLEVDAVEAAIREHPFYYPDSYVYDIYRKVCPIWNVGQFEPGFANPVASTIPVLILSGNNDTLTPPLWAEEIAYTLPNARLVRFAGIGHDVFATTPCARVITANFLDAPTKPLDTTCAEQIEPFFTLEQE